METKIRDLGTINFAPRNAPVWRAIRKCEKAGHTYPVRHTETVGNCLERVQCDLCGYRYEIDSSD